MNLPSSSLYQSMGGHLRLEGLKGLKGLKNTIAEKKFATVMSGSFEITLEPPEAMNEGLMESTTYHC